VRVDQQIEPVARDLSSVCLESRINISAPACAPPRAPHDVQPALGVLVMLITPAVEA
jgi:hypothetical protein